MSNHRIDLPGKGAGPRDFSAAVKEEIVFSTLEAGATVASVARRYYLDPSQIYQWRKALKVSRLPSGSAQELCVSAWNIFTADAYARASAQLSPPLNLSFAVAPPVFAAIMTSCGPHAALWLTFGFSIFAFCTFLGLLGRHRGMGELTR